MFSYIEQGIIGLDYGPRFHYLGECVAAFPESGISLPSMDLEEQRKLIEEAKQDSESFGKLYDYYFPKIYSFVAAKVSSRDDAEDLVSEIFMKALENLPRYEWRGIPFTGWLFKIARNALNNYYHLANKNRVYDIEKIRGISENEEKTSPHKKAADEELSTKVRHVMASLPEREMTVVQLKFFSQLNNREIMDVTGLSESNVAIILYRTLRKIKNDLTYFA